MPTRHVLAKIYVPYKNFHMSSQYLYKPCKADENSWENKNLPWLKNHMPSPARHHKSFCALGQDLHAVGMRARLNFESWYFDKVMSSYKLFFDFFPLFRFCQSQPRKISLQISGGPWIVVIAAIRDIWCENLKCCGDIWSLWGTPVTEIKSSGIMKCATSYGWGFVLEIYWCWLVWEVFHIFMVCYIFVIRLWWLLNVFRIDAIEINPWSVIYSMWFETSFIIWSKKIHGTWLYVLVLCDFVELPWFYSDGHGCKYRNGW